VKEFTKYFLMRVILNQPKNEKLVGVDVGRIREVVPGLDENLYFSTSNKDGNGKPKAEDDKIYRIVKAN